jgi:hypothetical protein
MTYTIKDIDQAWKGYENRMVLRVLKDGKWETLLDTPKNIIGTSAKQVPIQDVMSFPKYLREIWTR